MTRRIGFAFFAWLAVSHGFCQQAEGGNEQISRLVDSFFQAITHKDLDGAMSLWKADAPPFLSAREDLRRLFAPNQIRVMEARVERTTFTGVGRARTYISTDIEVRDSATGTPVEGFGRKKKLLDCVNDAGVWKITRYAPAEAELADALIAAGSAQDRARLTAASKEMVTLDLVRALCRAAGQAARKGQPQEALRLSDIAIETAESGGDKAALGWACIRKADILRDQASIAAAEPLAQRGLDLFREAKDRLGEAAARFSIGTLYMLKKEFDKASHEFEASLNLAKEIRDRASEGAALESIGEVFRLTGNLDKAIETFGKALEIRRALGDRFGEAAELMNLANVWQTKSENQKALDLYMQCMNIDEELHNKQGEAMDWGNIGTLQDAMARYPEALASLERGRQLDIETGNREGVAKALNDIGIVLMETGKPREALGKYTESLTLAVQIRDNGTQAQALANQGTAHQYLGEYGEALIAFQESLRLAQEAHDPGGEAQSRGSVAGVLSDAGHFEEALGLFAQTLPVFVKEGMKAEQGASLHNMATLYEKMGNYGEAAVRYQESLRIQKRSPIPPAK